MRSSDSNVHGSHLARSYAPSSLPHFCDSHAAFLFHPPDRHQVSSLPIKVGSQDTSRGMKHQHLDFFNPNSKEAKSHLLNQIPDTFYNAVFFPQELDLPSAEQGTRYVFHATFSTLLAVSCLLLPPTEDISKDNQPQALARKLQDHKKPNLRSFLHQICAAQHKDTRKQRKYVSAKHNLTLWMMTQRVKQKERGEHMKQKDSIQKAKLC